MRVTLLVPDVLWGRADDTQLFSRLATLPGTGELAATTPERLPYCASEAILAASSGIDDRAAVDLAVWRRRGEADEDQSTSEPGSTLLCADPVHLRFHQEFLIAADASQIGLDADEASQLVASLNAHFGSRARFHAATPARWYVELAEYAGPSWPPLGEIVGRSLAPRLFEPPQLQQIGSEAQMLLYAHAVNRERDAAGRPTANGVWLWGRLPPTDGAPKAAQPPQRIASDAPLAAGLARTLGIAAVADDDAAASLQPAHTLVVIDALRAAASLEAAEEFAAAWQTFARRWLAPLLARWHAGGLDAIELIAPCPTYGTLVWRWDRRPGPMARLFRALGKGRQTADLQTLARRLAAEAGR
jgi:hypothetical protein